MGNQNLETKNVQMRGRAVGLVLAIALLIAAACGGERREGGASRVDSVTPPQVVETIQETTTTTVPLNARQIEGSAVIVSAAGYRMGLTFSGTFHEPTIDITNSPPGSAELVHSPLSEIEMEVANMQPERNLPAYGFNVAFSARPDEVPGGCTSFSNVCDLRTFGGDRTLVAAFPGMAAGPDSQTFMLPPPMRPTWPRSEASAEAFLADFSTFPMFLSLVVDSRHFTSVESCDGDIAVWFAASQTEAGTETCSAGIALD